MNVGNPPGNYKSKINDIEDNQNKINDIEDNQNKINGTEGYKPIDMKECFHGIVIFAIMIVIMIVPFVYLILVLKYTSSNPSCHKERCLRYPDS